ncbi:hypothetical protein [Aquabacterium sp. J223]|uniref:hypothetical protein n=1 Tax=Aquabacterium sp. J223 TaxID=2898431 RepID=UPI0021AD60E5|nr:hypothetical protein [Aquabacterium sp. J223]UUX94563.1 hypothetical protein LRS07_14785 [Aquabacterium sp. J223]
MNNKTNTSSIESASELPAQKVAVYRFRAQFPVDADLVFAVLKRWLLRWQLSFSRDPGEHWPHGPIEVEVTLSSAAPGLPALRWLLGQLPDCDVAARSFDDAALYNGELKPASGAVPRTYREAAYDGWAAAMKTIEHCAAQVGPLTVFIERMHNELRDAHSDED